MTSADEVVARLRSLGDPSRLPGTARYGIATELRTVVREIGRDHGLAAELWDTGAAAVAARGGADRTADARD